MTTPSTAYQLQQTPRILNTRPVAVILRRRPEAQHKCVFNAISGHVTHLTGNLPAFQKLALIL